MVDKFFFVLFSMLTMGFVTVLEWDALFPDREDYSILMPLPIGSETLFASKFVALVLFLLCFSRAEQGSRDRTRYRPRLFGYEDDTSQELFVLGTNESRNRTGPRAEAASGLS